MSKSEEESEPNLKGQSEIQAGDELLGQEGYVEGEGDQLLPPIDTLDENNEGDDRSLTSVSKTRTSAGNGVQDTQNDSPYIKNDMQMPLPDAIERQEDLNTTIASNEEKSVDSSHNALCDDLERRPSIVSKTEILTSPGGTKTVKVGLKGSQQRESAHNKENLSTDSSSVSQSKACSRHQLQSSNDSDSDEETEHFLSENFDGAEVWHQDNMGTHMLDKDVDEEEAAIAAALADDMARGMHRKEIASINKTTEALHSEKAHIGNEQELAKLSNHASSKSSASSNINLNDILDEKDRQIEALQEQLMSALRGDTGVVDGLDASTLGGPDKRDAKIVTLAKKNRGLHLSLERQKTRIQQLEEELNETRKTQARGQARARVKRELSTNQVGNENEDSDENNPQHINPQRIQEIREQVHRELAERMADMEHRYDQMRQKCLRASNESKRLKRVLLREVGEGPQLDKLLEELTTGTIDDEAKKGAWRGRAQKIILLKDKLKRAQAQLAHIQNHQSTENSEDPNDGFLNSPGFSVNRSDTDVDARAARDIRTIEQERRHAMEKLANEYEQVEGELGEAKRTIHALRARGKVLEGETKRYKEQLKVLLKKTSNDDTLVDALRRELDRIKRELGSCRERTQSFEQSSRSSIEFEELKQHAMNQTAQIERQGQLLVKMRTEMERVKAAASRDIVQKAHEELDNQGHLVSSKLLKVENERLGELVDLFKQKLERAVLDREAALGKCKKLERAKVELERRLGNINAGGRKRQPMADQLSELRDQLALQVEETRVVRASAAQTIGQKDEEIRILREMGVQVKDAYERAIEDMKRQVQQTALEAQRRIQNSDSHVDDALLSQLTKDNEYLRSELYDMRDRKLSPTRSSPTFKQTRRR